MIASTFVGDTGQITSDVNVDSQSKSEIAFQDTNNADNTETTEAQTVTSPSKTTKQIVEEYFADTPILIDVASCESHFRQFNSDGTVLRGRVNSLDVGVMQINEKYHLGDAIKLGLDIHTLEGNMAYAKHLYKTQGTRPWEYSSMCWSKDREVALN